MKMSDTLIYPLINAQTKPLDLDASNGLRVR